MDFLIYAVARVLIASLQALPLTWVARLGRGAGALAYHLDGRHRRVAIRNLTNCFGAEMDAEQIRQLAKENFRRLGENYCCAAKTAGMSNEELSPYLEMDGGEVLRRAQAGIPPGKVVAAVGHFGNFELYARFAQFFPPLQGATTYRGVRQPGLNRLMQSLRQRSGCLFFERRTEGGALRATMAKPQMFLGLLADQHPGKSGVSLPFFGRDCLHSVAPVVFARRYDCVLCVIICYRVGLAKWRIEAGPEIPTCRNGEFRPVEDITADIVRAFEQAIRRDPANWFWVHNRWKPDASRRSKPEPVPADPDVEN